MAITAEIVQITPTWCKIVGPRNYVTQTCDSFGCKSKATWTCLTTASAGANRGRVYNRSSCTRHTPAHVTAKK